MVLKDAAIVTFQALVYAAFNRSPYVSQRSFVALLLLPGGFPRIPPQSVREEAGDTNSHNEITHTPSHRATNTEATFPLGEPIIVPHSVQSS